MVASTTLAVFEFIDEEEDEVEGDEEEDEFEERDVWICEKKILEDLLTKNLVLFVFDKRNSDIIVKKKKKL